MHALDAEARLPSLLAEAGVSGSARALIAFARMHLCGGEAADGTRVLSAASAQEMRQRQVDHPAAIGAASGGGLGWMLPAHPRLVEHGGATIGVAALLRIAPSRRRDRDPRPTAGMPRGWSMIS